RGERTRTVLGNGVEITRRFDPETFLVNRLSARRSPAGTGALLQDIEYTYDPTANIVRCVDNVQMPPAPGGFLQALNVSPECEYTYDALYQLVEATGRVHQALLEHDYIPNAPGTRKGTRHLSFNNGAAVERYTRTYDYDACGNIRNIHHHGVTRQWHTDLWISPTSNRSIAAHDPSGNPVPNPALCFDANGNCVSLAHLRRLDFNFRNNIARAVLIDRTGTGMPDDAEYYVYDSSGARTRKVTEKVVAGQLEVTDTVYGIGYEIKRVWRGAELRLERTTSIIGDGSSRIALIHRWAADTQAF